MIVVSSTLVFVHWKLTLALEEVLSSIEHNGQIKQTKNILWLKLLYSLKFIK